MRRRDRARRAGALLLGALLGAGVAGLAFWLTVQEARRSRVEQQLRTQLDLPGEAFSLERIRADTALGVRLRRVALLNAAGDTVLAAPSMRFEFDPRAIGGTGAFVFRDVRLQNPSVRLRRSPNGIWNYESVFRVEADGEPVRLPGGQTPATRALVFRDVRIEGGRVWLALPHQEAPAATGLAARFALARAERVARFGGVAYRVRLARDVDARIPEFRYNAGDWRVNLAAVDARLDDPDLRVQQLAGAASGTAAGEIRWDIRELRLDAGTIRTAGTLGPLGPNRRVDARVATAGLDLYDLRAIVPGLPDGRARFALGVRGPLGGRLAYQFSDLDVEAEGSRVRGRLGVLAGGGRPATFRDTRLLLDPLDLRTVERLGLAEQPLPVLGSVRGTVSAPTGSTGPLALDLSASLVPRGAPGAEPSRVRAVGGARFGDAGLVLDGLRVEAEPLRLATLRDLLPEQRDRLRGEVRGSATLSGPLSALRIVGGDLAYQVGDAPATRLRDLSGTVALGERLRYDLRGQADPLALATARELFPTLPVRPVAFAGPVQFAGDAENVRFNVDLRNGNVGRLAARGTVALGGAAPRFDVSGRVDGFQVGALLTGRVPTEGALAGTFNARGTPADLRFGVDLAQGGGTFALNGTLRRPAGGSPQFDVAGRVANFRIGALLGRPDLFPSPFTGQIALNGGGRQPIRFDVDLIGPGGLLDLNGWYLAGTVPSYAASGRVAGLNLRQVLGGRELPTTRINATVQLQGRGLRPEDLAGSLALVATGSTINGVVLDAATVRVAAARGVLRFDTADIALGGSRLRASGAWGLTRPLAEPLRVSFVSPDLRRLAPVLRATGNAPQRPLEGALRFEGTVAGSLRAPVVAGNLAGEALRFGEFRAATLSTNFRAARRTD